MNQASSDINRDESSLEALQADLDRLGEADRASAGAEFESRVSRASLDGAGRMEAPRALPLPAARPPAPMRAYRWRHAASLTLSAGALLSLAWLASKPTDAPIAAARTGAIESAPIAVELERLLGDTDHWDAGLSAAISAAQRDANSAAVRDTDAEFWADDDADEVFFAEDTL